MLGSLLGSIAQAAKGVGEAISIGGEGRGLFGALGNAVIGAVESVEGIAGVVRSEIAGVAGPSGAIIERAKMALGFGAESEVAAAAAPVKLGRSADFYNQGPSMIDAEHDFHNTVVVPATLNLKAGLGAQLLA